MLCLGRKSKRSRIADDVSRMFVSDNNIFSPQSVRLCVVASDGSAWQLEVTPDFAVDKLKVMALGHFLNPVEGVKLASQYKLVSVAEGRTLADDGTLVQENVKDNDELLLLRRRKPAVIAVPEQPETEQSSKGPDVSTINEMTKKVEQRNLNRAAEDSATVVDFQTELRKILISLVDASQKILCKNPDVLPIFKGMQEKVEERTVGDVDPNKVKQLTDMGFPESKAIKALKLNKMSPVEAMEWLLEHNIDPEMDASTSDKNKTIGRPTEITTTSYPTPTGVQAGSSMASNEATSSPPASPAKRPGSQRKGFYTVAEMLETFKAYKRKGFRPNSRCEWLLGERRPTPEEMQNGLDPNGPIYKAIISNPVVQLGLNNPKTLLAFLHMLENPNTANHWLNDPDTSPLLSQIFRIYHAEKHSLQVNESNNANSNP